jgi:hypothetical protein
MHKHKCPNCGDIWQHGEDHPDSAAFKAAHTCQRCGTYQTWKHDDPAEAGTINPVTLALRDLLMRIFPN